MAEGHWAYRFLRRLALGGLLVAAASCGGGGGGSETLAWIRIDTPADGYVTNSESIVIEGNAALRSGDYPSESIYWYNGQASGVAANSVVCIVGCVAAWRATVPLNVGQNTITLRFVDAIASLSATRNPTVSVQGRTTLSSSSGVSVPDVTVSLSGASGTTWTRTDASGSFTLRAYQAGSYSLTPSLPLPQSDSCLSFAPASRDIDVSTADIFDQNFIATETASCFAVSGRITASNNPTYGQPGVTVALADAQGHEMNAVTDASGAYSFHHLIAGTYTITPRDCILSYCSTFVPESIAVTVTSGDVSDQDFLRQF